MPLRRRGPPVTSPSPGWRARPPPVLPAPRPPPSPATRGTTRPEPVAGRSSRTLLAGQHHHGRLVVEPDPSVGVGKPQGDPAGPGGPPSPGRHGPHPAPLQMAGTALEADPLLIFR